MDRTLTVERLREVLRYSSDGRFFRTIDICSRARAGDQAGTLKASGYWMICIDYEDYYEHHLAWLWCYGHFPKGNLDHIDGNKWNNRISNLRVATQSQNIANSRLSSANKSGHKGVSWSKVAKKWHAIIGVNGKNIHLGYFTERSDAAQAYRDAALKHFGEFARAREKV